MTADPRAGAGALIATARDLAWSLWTELGVSSWQRQHADWSIELEPLIVHTATLAREDPRLAREAVDWCVSNERFVSLQQLRHVITTQRWPVEGSVATFGATVQAHSRRGRRWPGTPAEPLDSVSLSHRSWPPDLRRPALLQLRLRALFGVSTRAEIIRVLLLPAPVRRSAKEIADRVIYTRRQVDLELEMLVAGGLIRRFDHASPTTYACDDPAALHAVIGPTPAVAPRWAPTMRLLSGLMEAFNALSERSWKARSAKLRRHLRQLDAVAHDAGLDLPMPTGDDQGYVHGVVAWTVNTYGAIARGDRSLRTDTRLGHRHASEAGR
jgi:hypothetical protein